MAALKRPQVNDNRDQHSDVPVQQERDIEEEDFEIEPDAKQKSKWKSNQPAELDDDSPKQKKKEDLRQGIKSGFNFKELIKEGSNIDDIESIENRGSESQNPVSDRWPEDMSERKNDKPDLNKEAYDRALEGLLAEMWDKDLPANENVEQLVEKLLEEEVARLMAENNEGDDIDQDGDGLDGGEEIVGAIDD